MTQGFSRYPQYVVLAHRPSTDECEWSVCTGKDAREAAEHEAKKWGSKDGWLAFVRPTDAPIAAYPH